MTQFKINLNCPMAVSEDQTPIECEFKKIFGKISLEWVIGLERKLTDYEFFSIMGDYHETLERQAEEKIDRKFEEFRS